MKRFTFVAVAAVVIAGFVVSQGAPMKPNDVAAFMQLKLDRSIDLLEGIVLEDFPAIAKHSQQLSLLSQESTWQVVDTPEYVRHSAEFRRAVDSISQAARDKNIDAATLGYMEMTLKCVQCHKYVRDVRMAQADGHDLKVGASRALQTFLAASDHVPADSN